ncbi:MAG: hypothetical protein IJ746_04455 [Ruminococcus sp.]|nr:hypothetical protein [Ruminococcus sp.]
MKNIINVGEVYFADLQGEVYSGRRMVLVAAVMPGLAVVYPIRTSKLHRSCRSSLLIDKGSWTKGRKVSADSSRIITLHTDALKERVGFVNEEWVKEKLNDRL